MFTRILSRELKLLAEKFRVLTVLGPRQAGKTTLCRSCFPEYRYVSLEDPDIRLYAEEDPRGFLADNPAPVILDEIQRVPQLLSYIQTEVDREPGRGRYILTGSDQLSLGEEITQSLAGRTAILTLLPLSLEELPVSGRSDIRCVLEGFMPEKHQQQIECRHYYRSYFQTYVERDVRRLVQLKDVGLFEKFVRLCAGRTGSLLNLSSMANDVGVSANTVAHWISILEASYVLFRLPPYFESFNKRLIKAPKLYFYDTGLACWLLGIENEGQLERDPLRGSLFENMVIIEAMKSLLNRGREPRLYYFRDSRGNEVDLLLAQGRKLVPVEIKSASTWHSSFQKGIVYFQELAGERAGKGIVVYTGEQERNTDSYRLVPFVQSPGFALSDTAFE